MTLIKVEKYNEAFIRVFSDKSTEQELSEFFKFAVPGAKYMPKFKARIWDGYARLYNLNTKTLYAGLIKYVEEFAKRNDYEIQIDDNITYDNGINLNHVEDFAKLLKLHSKNKPIELRDYQFNAIHKALNECRTLLISPTSSGKSAIIYTLIRWFTAKKLKCLIIVPNTSLVEQLYSDFEDYSSHNGWSTESNCQKLYSGLSKDFNKNVLLTTWQSTFKLSQQWCNQFDVVISDEAHLAKASSQTAMFEKMTEVKYRIGTTGTIDNTQISQLQLEGILGPVHRVITTKELMDSNRVVNLSIKCLLLNYPEDIRKIMCSAKYQAEMDYIISNEKRNKFIVNLAIQQSGNTLILFQFVEKHGKVLQKMIIDKIDSNRTVYYISGETATEERESIRHKAEKDQNAIILASFGTMSTGVNMPSIENIIFSSPSKSKIRNLQSIGRGLRLKEGKSSCNLYDISDNFSHKSKSNHTLGHLAERIKIYTAEEFDMKIININL